MLLMNYVKQMRRDFCDCSHSRRLEKQLPTLTLGLVSVDIGSQMSDQTIEFHGFCLFCPTSWQRIGHWKQDPYAIEAKHDFRIQSAFMC